MYSKLTQHINLMQEMYIPCSTFILRGLIFADLILRMVLIRRNRFQQKKATSKIKTQKFTPVNTIKNGCIIHWGKKERLF